MCGERVFQSAAATKTPGIGNTGFLIGCHKKGTRIYMHVDVLVGSLNCNHAQGWIQEVPKGGGGGGR